MFAGSSIYVTRVPLFMGPEDSNCIQKSSMSTEELGTWRIYKFVPDNSTELKDQSTLQTNSFNFTKIRYAQQLQHKRLNSIKVAAIL
jgi:hypothetical protein